MLTTTSTTIPSLPANPSMLPSIFGDRILEIHDGVYAMWEIGPGDYLVHAIPVAGYAGAYVDQAPGKIVGSRGVSRALTCAPGSVLFIAVGDVGFSNTLLLEDLDPDRGMEYVRNSLLSAGVNAGAPGYRDCELKW